MKSDAQAHASEDKKRKEEIENEEPGRRLVFQTRKQIKDLGDKNTLRYESESGKLQPTHLKKP